MPAVSLRSAITSKAPTTDGQGHHLFGGVGDDVVGVADLLGREAGDEVLGEVVAVLLVDVRLHLQGLDGGDAGDVLGEEGLVPRPSMNCWLSLSRKRAGRRGR